MTPRSLPILPLGGLEGIDAVQRRSLFKGQGNPVQGGHALDRQPSGSLPGHAGQFGPGQICACEICS